MTVDRTAVAYDTVAETYDSRFVDELDAKPRDRELLDRFAAATRGPVIDVGCGPGQIGAYLRGRGRDVIGVDVSHRMAVRAASRLRSAVVADMRALPFRDRALGGVVAFYSVIHLPRGDLGTAFGEFLRTLGSRGRVLVSTHEGEGEVEVHDFLGHDVEFSATLFVLDELEETATAVGLVAADSERRPPYENEGSTVRLYIEAARPEP